MTERFKPNSLWRHKNGKHYLIEKVATLKVTSTSPYAALDGEKVVRYLASDGEPYDRLATEWEASFSRVDLFQTFHEMLSRTDGATEMVRFVGSLLEEGWKHHTLFSIINDEVLGKTHRADLTEEEFDYICDHVLDPLSGWGTWPDSWPQDKKWVRPDSYPNTVKRKGK